MKTIDNKKTYLILNPAAGKGKGKSNFKEIQTRLEEKFKNLEIHISRFPGHIISLAQDALLNDCRRIISVGGDGTPFEIINGLFSKGIPTEEIELGMIPAGTGNSFLRDFDDAKQENWIATILNGKTRRVDLVEFSYLKQEKEIKNYYINILGIGLIADILKLTNEKLKFLGTFGYSAAVLIRLFRGMNNKMQIQVDGEEFHLKNSALVISNSKFTGGDMKIAPMADTEDGKVDLIVFEQVNRRDIISIFSNVFKGTHINHPKVKVISGADITITAEPHQLLMADGELLGETPLKLRVLPGALKILA